MPNLPVANVQTVQEIYDHSMARTSFTLVMLALAASMALLLGVVGIYGVISYSITRRTREIGIRIALGASQETVRGMFVRQGLLLAALGVAAGVAAAMPLTRLMSTLLFDVSPLDPLTYAAVAAGPGGSLPAGDLHPRPPRHPGRAGRSACEWNRPSAPAAVDRSDRQKQPRLARAGGALLPCFAPVNPVNL